jgi:hypothetical protein
MRSDKWKRNEDEEEEKEVEKQKEKRAKRDSHLTPRGYTDRHGFHLQARELRNVLRKGGSLHDYLSTLPTDLPVGLAFNRVGVVVCDLFDTPVDEGDVLHQLPLLLRGHFLRVI